MILSNINIFLFLNTGITNKAKKEGAYPKGYYLEVTEVKADDLLGGAETPVRIFPITQSTHDDNIFAHDNTDCKFLAEP